MLKRGIVLSAQRVWKSNLSFPFIVFTLDTESL